jgi:bifunctional non-homologous end joining protein LigD
MAKAQTLEVEGRPVPVSNLDKVLYPGTGFTKAQVIDFYIRASRWLLPHLEQRPVTMKRYPDGVQTEHFYEKDAPSFTPEWVKTFPVPRRAGGDIDYILINDLPTLVWCANLANLEIHPFLHRAPHLNRPDWIVFDLDPGEGVDVLGCVEVAFLLKELLDKLKLKSFAKVSGSKGLQLYIPLNTAVTYEVTQPFARALAELLARQYPKRVVFEMAKPARKGKVFIDWSQNTDYKTTVSVYSLRAKSDRPYVSLPLTWPELKAALAKGDPASLYFEPEAALARMKQKRDLFATVLKLKQQLPSHQAENHESLKAYRAKRDFTITSEPPPQVRSTGPDGKRRFVIQKHAASQLHYDFRLEMHGVLKSWAVPKGVPYTSEEKRLAMATEDHPVGYLDFEGTIPQGQYGGGTVMVWDIGTYDIVDGDYYKGKLHIVLNGKKLKGEWVIVKNRTDARKWLLLKAGGPMKPPSAKKEDSSAITGRTMKQIAAANDAQWQSNRLTRGS